MGLARVSRDPGGPRGAAAAPRCASVGERSSPSFAARARRGVAAGSGKNLLSALLSVTEEHARECEDAVDLTRCCESFPFALKPGEKGVLWRRRTSRRGWSGL